MWFDDGTGAVSSEVPTSEQQATVGKPSVDAEKKQEARAPRRAAKSSLLRLPKPNSSKLELTLMSKKLTEKVEDDRKLSKNTTSICLWCLLAVWIMLQQ